MNSESPNSCCKYQNFGHYILKRFPTMEKLKFFKLDVLAESDCPLIDIHPVIEASPYLEKFVIQIEWSHDMVLGETEWTYTSVLFRPPHQHLKIVKFCGYFGRVCDLELARYLFRCCAALEKFIVDPHCRGAIDPGRRYKKNVRAARGRAKRQLEGIKPGGVKLVIL
ncbi:hypothetical protein ACH5RR_008457 [Cinchona calisaya]|uniref:FBD domain-containing protein n=1 Tax=Cinchona calisaya TaxID=153742 RepID=A0ABD3AF17_9GENT